MKTFAIAGLILTGTVAAVYAQGSAPFDLPPANSTSPATASLIHDRRSETMEIRSDPPPGG